MKDEQRADDERLTASGEYWWLAASSEDDGGEELARTLTRVAQSREMRDIPRRFRNLTYFRHFTGRPALGTYAFGMGKRPSNFISHYGDSEFTPPRFNLIGTCADVYVTRLLTHQTHISFVPDATDFGQRQVSLDIEGWVEGGFTELNYFGVRKLAGLDALCYGKGWIKTARSWDDKAEFTAPSPDELLFANYDDPHPNEYIQRMWVSREDVFDRYGTTPEARRAIIAAQHAEPAFFFDPGTLDTSNVIPLLYGLRAAHCDKEKTPGREVLVVGNYVIYDRPWKDQDINLEGFDFHEVGGALNGAGIPELLLTINEEIDEQLAVEQESFIRSGSGKWLYDEAGDIDVDSLGDTVASAVSVAPGAKYPEYVTPDPITERSAERIDRMVKLGMRRVHISENAVQGEVPKQLTSAVALDSWAKIDDVNFGELISREEDWDLRNAYQLVRIGKILKPKYTRTGSSRQIIDWKSLKIGDNTIVGLKGLNVGRFGQTLAAQRQELAAMLAAGEIDRATYNKYLQVTNNQQMLDQLNEPEVGADWALDQLVIKGEFEPPLPFLNLDYAQQAVEARYSMELRRRTPQDTLDNLLMWRAAVKEMKAQQHTPDPNTPGFNPAAMPASAPGAPVGTDASIPGQPVPIPGATPPPSPGAPA